MSLERKTKELLIGIDAGVNTGIAIWDTGESKFISVSSCTILNAIRQVHQLRDRIKSVIVEDARQVQYNTSKAKAQGAGSVKRDCKIWEEFLVEAKIPHKFVRPSKSITKWDKNRFKAVTGWKGITNEHGRDAGMLIFGRKGMV